VVVILYVSFPSLLTSFSHIYRNPKPSTARSNADIQTARLPHTASAISTSQIQSPIQSHARTTTTTTLSTMSSKTHLRSRLHAGQAMALRALPHGQKMSHLVLQSHRRTISLFCRTHHHANYFPHRSFYYPTDDHYHPHFA
jgi:hypothetical protein